VTTDQKPLAPRKEAFAQALAAGKSQADAYRIAYPRSAQWKPEALWAQASRTAAEPRVSVRVAELRSAVVERHQITVDDLIRELEEARMLAVREGQTSAAVSATMGKAKLLGYGMEKVSVTGPGGGPLQILGGQMPSDVAAVLRKRLDNVRVDKG
jgi:hypothetical protein